MENPNKRRRLTKPAEDIPTDGAFSDIGPHHALTAPSLRLNDSDAEPKSTENENIFISATSKHAGQIVAPFLAKHIPDQYAPLRGPDPFGDRPVKDSNSKYCYRHRPDLKCRRQADEPSMDQLQHVRSVSTQIDCG